MLSAKPMEPLASVALAGTTAPPSPSTSSPSTDPDRLHLLTSTGRRLSTAPGSVDSSHISSLVGSTTSQTPMQLWPAKDSTSNASRPMSAGTHLSVPPCDDSGKLAPINSNEQVSPAPISMSYFRFLSARICLNDCLTPPASDLLGLARDYTSFGSKSIPSNLSRSSFSYFLSLSIFEKVKFIIYKRAYHAYHPTTRKPGTVLERRIASPYTCSSSIITTS